MVGEVEIVFLLRRSIQRPRTQTVGGSQQISNPWHADFASPDSNETTSGSGSAAKSDQLPTRAGLSMCGAKPHWICFCGHQRHVMAVARPLTTVCLPFKQLNCPRGFRRRGNKNASLKRRLTNGLGKTWSQNRTFG